MRDFTRCVGFYTSGEANNESTTWYGVLLVNIVRNGAKEAHLYGMSELDPVARRYNAAGSSALRWVYWYPIPSWQGKCHRIN